MIVSKPISLQLFERRTLLSLISYHPVFLLLFCRRNTNKFCDIKQCFVVFKFCTIKYYLYTFRFISVSTKVHVILYNYIRIKIKMEEKKRTTKPIFSFFRKLSKENEDESIVKKVYIY